MDAKTTEKSVNALWDDSIVPALTEYIRIPNQSPAYDAKWVEAGHMERAVELARRWVEAREIPNSRLEILRLPGRTPLLLLEIDGQRAGTVLMYGHLDKQPPLSGWHEGLGPWTPVYRDGKLYGRGGADDGYAVFASVAAIEALRAQGEPLPRIVAAIECSEESGSPDLPAYITEYAERIGVPDLVVCLDSGAGDYERLWATTSLRGLIAGDLRVDVLDHGVHSGDASGIVPSSFRILRTLLARLEDAETGKVLMPQLFVEVPAERLAQARHAAEVLGDTVHSKFGLIGQPMNADTTELILNRTWRPTLSVTGADGLPPLAQAGSVLRPYTSLRLSVRIPPHVDPDAATAKLKRLLTADPPYGAKVTFDADAGASPWEAPPTAPWLEDALRASSQAYFGKPYAALGEGGTIPFMGMLSAKFPKAQFIVTGVLGPESNAHGPNEFLHVPFAKKLTCCIADIIARLPGPVRMSDGKPINDGWGTAMGFKVVVATADEVEVEWTVARQHLQPFGIVHGGVHCGAIETVCSYGAALSAKGRGHQGGVVGLENHTSFIRAVREGAVLRCRATPLTRGRSTQVWEATVRDGNDKLVATGRVRLLAVTPGEV